MKMYMDSASMYIQLSTAALALTIAFLEKLFGTQSGSNDLRDPRLVASWVCFLLAILFGSVYQYLAVHRVDLFSVDPGTVTRGLPKWAIENPGWIYGVMLVAFYAGVLCFVALAVHKFGYRFYPLW